MSRLSILFGAFCTSAAAGGAAVAAAFGVLTATDGLGRGGGWDGILLSIMLGGIAGIAAIFAYFIGAVVVGVPAFFLMVRANWTTPGHAAAAGVLLSTIAATVDAKADPSALAIIAIAAFGGACAGLAFRQASLPLLRQPRRSPPPAPPA